MSLDEVLIYGRCTLTLYYLEKYLDSCFIINTKNSKTTSLPKGIKRSSAQALLFNNSVYVFGGRCNQHVLLKDCHRFDIESKNWKILSPLCTELTSTLLILWKTNEILVVGSNSDGNRYLLNYKITEDIYLHHDFSYSHKSYYANILVSSEKNIILLSAQTLFVTNIGDSFSWKKIEADN